MKIFNLLFWFFFFSHISFCQDKLSGTLNYDLLFDKTSKTDTKISCSLYFSKTKTISTHNSLVNYIEKIGNETLIIPKNQVYQFKDFKNKVLISTQSRTLVLKDTMRLQKWKISNETKKIEKFICKKATGKVYGRNYEVWYCPEIPIASGPWKFYGLPGMILEANEIGGNLQFKFVSIQFSNASEILLPQITKAQKLVGLKDFLKLSQIEIKKVEKPVITSSKVGESITKTKIQNGLEIWGNL